LAWLVAALPSGAEPEAAAGSEYDVKAVFLYKFTRYLQWPAGDEPEAFEIAVLGESPILEPLQAIALRKTVGALPIVVRRCGGAAEIGRPRILFVPGADPARLARALEAVRGAGVLTVAEHEGAAGEGAAINFILRNEALRFEINERALAAAGIQAGSQLLKLAVRGPGPGGRER
jgi:hypothetical protein